MKKREIFANLSYLWNYDFECYSRLFWIPKNYSRLLQKFSCLPCIPRKKNEKTIHAGGEVSYPFPKIQILKVVLDLFCTVPIFFSSSAYTLRKIIFVKKLYFEICSKLAETYIGPKFHSSIIYEVATISVLYFQTYSCIKNTKKFFRSIVNWT